MFLCNSITTCSFYTFEMGTGYCVLAAEVNYILKHVNHVLKHELEVMKHVCIERHTTVF